MRGMFKLAFRDIFRQRGRSALTLLAIAFGVASMIVAGGFVEDILVQLREATVHSQLGHLQVYRRGYLEDAGKHPFDALIADPAVVARAVDGVPGVIAHGARLAFSGLINNGRAELPMLGEGVEPEAETRIGSALSLLAGRALAPQDRFSILVGEGLANALKLRPGARVNLVANSAEGAVNTLEFEVVGVFRSLSKDYDARAVRVPLAAAQELTVTHDVSAVVVLLDDSARTDVARAQLAAALGDGFEVRTWEELADFYKGTAALYERQFGVLQLIILVMVLLGVANTVTMTLHERTAEFGILRALGDTGAKVFRLAVTETAIVGLIGASAGVLLGIALALVLSAVGIPMPPPPNSESGFTAAIRIVPRVLATAFALGLAGSVAASLLPARHAARMPIVESLRRGV